MTRLALAQRAHLAGELSARGIDCHSLIVADDENLDVAREMGADTLRHPNRPLSDKCNAGLEYAGRNGADHVVWIGSDDWVHPDLFESLLPEQPEHRTQPIITGRKIAIVDLQHVRMRHCLAPGRNGVIPWIIPRQLLAPCGFRPLPDGKDIGLDGHLIRGMREHRVKPTWLFHDPHPLARVDFKSSVNLNSYEALAGLGHGPEDEDPWPALAEHYPPELVALARATSIELQEA